MKMNNQLRKKLCYATEYSTDGETFAEDEEEATAKRLLAMMCIRDIYRGINDALNKSGFKQLMVGDEEEEKEKAKESIFKKHNHYWMFTHFEYHHRIVYTGIEPRIVIRCNKTAVEPMRRIVKQESAFYRAMYARDIAIIIQSVTTNANEETKKC